MTQNIHKHRILILTSVRNTLNWSPAAREIGAYCELWAWDVSEEQIREFNPSGIILSGGPESTTEAGSPRAPDYVFNAGVPVLGVYYGMQTMAMCWVAMCRVPTNASSATRRWKSSKRALLRNIEDAISPAGKPLLDVR